MPRALDTLIQNLDAAEDTKHDELTKDQKDTLYNTVMINYSKVQEEMNKLSGVDSYLKLISLQTQNKPPDYQLEISPDVQNVLDKYDIQLTNRESLTARLQRVKEELALYKETMERVENLKSILKQEVPEQEESNNNVSIQEVQEVQKYIADRKKKSKHYGLGKLIKPAYSRDEKIKDMELLQKAVAQNNLTDDEKTRLQSQETISRLTEGEAGIVAKKVLANIPDEYTTLKDALKSPTKKSFSQTFRSFQARIKRLFKKEQSTDHNSMEMTVRKDKK